MSGTRDSETGRRRPTPRRRGARRAAAPLALAALAALAVCALVPREAVAFEVFGDVLDLSQRDFRVFDNFTGAFASDNQIPDPDFPGSLGATLAARKAVAEWGSGPHGTGTTDPLQDVLGSGDSNFDAYFAGAAPGPGGTNENVISALPGASFVLAFTELPIGDGWRILVYDGAADWHDGPGPPVGGAMPFDLQGVLTHEYGHALGLDHSFVPGATMRAGAGNQRGVDLRTIEADDRAGVQFLYGVKSPVKPQITSYELAPGGAPQAVRLVGAGFAATGNEVWFTPRALGTGAPVRVSGLASPTGTTLDVVIPQDAGPGDVLVRLPGAATDRLSNAFPFDPQRAPWAAPRAYGPAGVSSSGQELRLGTYGLPSLTAGSFQLTLTGGPPSTNAVVFSGAGAARLPGRFGEVLVDGPWRREAVMSLFFGAGEASVPVAAAEVGTTRYLQVLVLDPALPAGGALSDALEVTLVP